MVVNSLRGVVLPVGSLEEVISAVSRKDVLTLVAFVDVEWNARRGRDTGIGESIINLTFDIHG